LTKRLLPSSQILIPNWLSRRCLFVYTFTVILLSLHQTFEGVLQY